LPLPIAGIITDEPVDKVARKLQAVRKAAHDLGCQLEHPFLTLSFMALPVIPELRITDKGLVDAEEMKIVPVLLD
jgi:adenine deaminase